MTDMIAWEQDKALYLFTSLTAGSSHVITATSRIETILKSARIPFSYIDTATNESAKKLYQRRGKGKKLPLLVKEGFVIADLEQVEDWNEFGELNEAIGTVAITSTSHTTTPAIAPVRTTGSADTSYASVPVTTNEASSGLETPLAKSSLGPGPGTAISEALRKAAFESASAAKDKKVVPSALMSPLEPTPPAPVSTPVAGPPLSPTRVPLPSSPLKEAPVNSISEVVSAAPVGNVVSPPSGSVNSGSSHFDPPIMMHRGSSISQISQEEIKEIESREAIKEEDEEDHKDEAGIKTKIATASVPQQVNPEPSAPTSTKAEPAAENEDQASHSKVEKEHVA